MLNTNIETYEKLTAEQVWSEIDQNYAIESGSTVYRYVSDEHIVMISKCVDEWCCEIDIIDDGEYSTGFGETPEEALAAAIVDFVGYDVLRDGEEENCEDASNVTALRVFEFIYGEDVSFDDIDNETYDKILSAACEFVKKEGKYFGIEWVEYRW